MKHSLMMWSLLFAVGGCGTAVDPCKGIVGACIALRVEGGAMVDQLAITLDTPSPATKRTPDPAVAPFSLPASVALTLPAGTSGRVTISVDGLRSDTIVGHGDTVVDLPASGRGRATVRLVALGGEPDLFAGGDTDMPPLPPDLGTGVGIAGAGPTSIFETEPATLPLTAVDPMGTTLTLSATNVPSQATFSATGNMATLMWTPSFKDAAVYNIKLTATSSDPSRTVMTTWPLTVRQTIDPVLGQDGAALSTMAAVGDFDGDGFGDLAACTHPSGKYTVQILYGAASGLPLVGGYASGPTGRTDFFDITSTDVGSSTDCRVLGGGDFDGDAKGDVIFANTSAAGGTGHNVTNSGRAYVFYGFARGGSHSPQSAELLDPGAQYSEYLGNGANVGGTLVIGDYNGDGKIDVAAALSGYQDSGLTAASSTVRVALWFGTATTPGNPAVYSFTNYTQTSGSSMISCASSWVLGFGDMDGDGKQELLVHDPYVNYVAPCPSFQTKGTVGGLLVFHGGGAMDQFPVTLGHNNGLTYAWGGQSMLCDFNGDDKADLVVVDDSNSVNANATAVHFFPANGTWPPLASTTLDPSSVGSLSDPAGYAAAFCARKFHQGASAIMLDVPNTRVDIVVSRKAAPVINRSVTPPIQALFFGALDYGVTDVNNDGALDWATFQYVLYGR